MRVLLVTNDFPPTIGGIQSYLRDFISTLPPQDVVVFASTQDAAAAASSGAMSSLTIFSMASVTRLTFSWSGSLISSPSRRGAICQERPQRSFSQPHCSTEPPSFSASQSRSRSPCV